MGFFDFLKRKPADAALVGAELSGIVPSDTSLASLPPVADPFAGFGEHPFVRKVQGLPGYTYELQAALLLFHLMRKHIPTLDAAIRNRRTLEGDVLIKSDDDGLQEALTEVADSFTCGYFENKSLGRGLNTYLDMLSSASDEYGMASGEAQLTEDLTEIRRLVVPTPQSMQLRKNDAQDAFEIWQGDINGRRQRIDDKLGVDLLTFSTNTEEPWPTPMAWSLVTSSQNLLEIYVSMVNQWWKFGDPPLLNVINYKPDASIDMETVGGSKYPKALLALKRSMESIMSLKRRGRTGDVYAYADGGDIRSEVIGNVDATLMRFAREHATLFDAYIIAASRTPVWMYPGVIQKGDGLGGQKSTNEALIASVDAMKRNSRRAAIAKSVLDLHLILSGDARWLGKYWIKFDTISIIDEKAIGEAQKAQADADAQHIENAAQLYEDETGERRFKGEAEQYLIQQGVYAS